MMQHNRHHQQQRQQQQYYPQHQQNQHQHHQYNHQQQVQQQQQQQQQQFLDQSITLALNQLVDRLNNPEFHALALLIGTSDGVGLARVYGSTPSLSPHMSEEIISGVESIWATLPSGSGHHLRPLGLGDDIKTVTAFYENCTLVHACMSPLVGYV